MRPRIVENLNQTLGGNWGDYLIPAPVMMYVLAISAVLLIFVHRCRQSDLSCYHALGFCFWGIIGGMIGARAIYLLLHLKTTLSHPAQILDLNGGTASWGAYIGGAIGFTLYLEYHRQKLLPYADVLASCLALGPFLGRWSCFLNGCCFGKPSELPWAVRYPQDSIPYLIQLQEGLLEESAMLSLPVHPVQIYQALTGLALFLLMTWFWKRCKFQAGVTFLAYWIIYSITRFVWDFWRADAVPNFLGPFTSTQTMAILFTVVSAIALYGLFIRSRTHYIV